MGKQLQTDSAGLLDWATGVGVEKVWTQRVGALCLLSGLLSALGCDAASILASIGLTAASLEHPDNRITYTEVGQLLAVSAHAAKRPHLGVTVGRVWTLEHMGLVGQLMKHSPTLGDALRTLAVYHRLESEGATVYLSENKEVAVLGYAVFQPQVAGIDQLYDTALTSGLNLIRELLGEPAKPLKVAFARVRPSDPQPYQDFFRARLQFDSDHSALYLSRRLLDQPVPGADPELRRQLEARAEAAGATDLAVRLHRALRVLLLQGEVSGDGVAQQLAMHRRTLHRRLRAQGTTFQRVLDDVRWEVSRQLLGHTALPLGKIASAIGYADTSTFVRAFHRWSGTTPAKWREAKWHEQ